MSDTIGGLFGDKKKSETTQRVHLPDYAKKPFKRALRMAEAAVDQPFERYPTEDRILDFTDDELQAFNLTRDLVGKTAPIIDQSREVTGDVIRQGLGGIDQSLIEAYMNPYTENVLDVRRDRALRDIDRTRRDLADQRANIGAFGGSRADINEMLYLDESQRRLNEMEAEELRNAYGQGLAGAERGLQRAGQASIDQANLAQLGRNVQIQDIGALSGIGGQQRALDQAGADFDYSEFVRQQQDPYQKAQFLSGIAQPMAATVRGSNSTTEQTTTPGLGKVAMQIGAMAMGLPGGGGGGGGLSSSVAGAIPSGSTFGSSGQFLSGGGINQAMKGGGSFGVGSDPYNLLGGRSFYNGGLVATDNSYAEGGLVNNPLYQAAQSRGAGENYAQERLNDAANMIRGLTRERSPEEDQGFDLRDLQEFATSPVRLGEGIVGLGAQALGFEDDTRVRDVMSDAGDSLMVAPGIGLVGKGIGALGAKGAGLLKGLSPTTKMLGAGAGLQAGAAVPEMLENLSSDPQSTPMPAEEVGPPPVAVALQEGNRTNNNAAQKEDRDVLSAVEVMEQMTGGAKLPKPVKDTVEKAEKGKLNTSEQFEKEATRLRKRLENDKRKKGYDPRWLAFAAGIGKGSNLTESLSYALEGFMEADQKQGMDVLAKEEAIRGMAAQRAGMDMQDLQKELNRRQIQAQEAGARLKQQMLPLEMAKIQSEIQKNLAKSNPAFQNRQDAEEAYIKSKLDHVGPGTAKLTPEQDAELRRQIFEVYGANPSPQSSQQQRAPDTSGFDLRVKE